MSPRALLSPAENLHYSSFYFFSHFFFSPPLLSSATNKIQSSPLSIHTCIQTNHKQRHDLILIVLIHLSLSFNPTQTVPGKGKEGAPPRSRSKKAMRALLWVPLMVAIQLATPATSVVNVVPLRYENFEGVTQVTNISSKKDWIVFFYAPWCKHCKKFEPTFNKLSSRLFGKLSFATVNVKKEPRLAERFSVEKFPTVMVFHAGKIYPYRSKHRTLAEVQAFADGGFKFSRPVPIPLDFTVVQVVWRIVWRDILLVMVQMYKNAPMPAFLNLSIGIVIGVVLMFLIMKGAMIQQLDDIDREHQERRDRRKKRKEAKKKKEN